MDIHKLYNDLGVSHFCKEPEILVAKEEIKSIVFEDVLSILREKYPIRPSYSDRIREFNLIKMGKYSKIDSV